MSVFAELKRRNVIRMAGLYLVGAWLVVQVGETLLPIFGAPPWVLGTLVALLAIGFVPTLVFSWVYELTPEGLRRDADVPAAQSIAPVTARRMDVLLVIGLVAVVALVAADRYWPKPAPAPVVAAVPAPVAAAAPAAAKPVPVVPHKSIAVLPFVNMSADQDNEFFSDGISEEILNALAQVDDLKVAGRTSSFHYKGSKETLAAIGSALGVAHVLEGSVRKQGGKVRITAQLIQVKDGFHLWSETYDGDLEDVFALQESIARSITDELKIVLQGEQATRLVKAGTANPEAYALYLQATSIFNRREGARFADAVDMLHRAIALDPQFARAYSRLATLHGIMTNYVSADAEHAAAEVEKNARRASEIDPTLAEPHAALGASLSYQRRFGESRAAYARALALDPDDVTMNFWRGITLLATGYTREGLAAVDEALRVDPMLPNALLWRGRAYIADGDLEKGEQMLRAAAEGGHSFVAFGYAWLEEARGNRAGAIEQMTRGLKTFSPEFPPEAPEIFARAVFGDAKAKARALELIDAYLATKPKDMPGVVPFVLVRSGEIERGFALMQDKPTTNDSLLSGQFFTTLVPGARTSPLFPEFARRMGWAAHWDEFGPPDLCSKADNGDYTCR